MLMKSWAAALPITIIIIIIIIIINSIVTTTITNINITIIININIAADLALVGRLEVLDALEERSSSAPDDGLRVDVQAPHHLGFLCVCVFKVLFVVACLLCSYFIVFSIMFINVFLRITSDSREERGARATAMPRDSSSGRSIIYACVCIYIYIYIYIHIYLLPD